MAHVDTGDRPRDIDRSEWHQSTKVIRIRAAWGSWQLRFASHRTDPKPSPPLHTLHPSSARRALPRGGWRGSCSTGSAGPAILRLHLEPRGAANARNNESDPVSESASPVATALKPVSSPRRPPAGPLPPARCRARRPEADSEAPGPGRRRGAEGTHSGRASRPRPTNRGQTRMRGPPSTPPKIGEPPRPPPPPSQRRCGA
jgi:hypothetical protein